MKKFSVIAVIVVIALVLVGAAQAATDMVADGGFESGPGGGVWTEYSANGWGIIDSVLPRTGTYGAWIGGAGGTGEVGSVSQDITFPANGTVEITFYLWPYSADNAGDYLDLSLGGSSLWSHDDSYLDSASDFMMITAGGPVTAGTHTLSFLGTDSYGGNTNWFIDDVTVMFTESTGPAGDDDDDDDVVEVPVPGPDMIEIPADAVVGTVLADTPAYFAPQAGAATTIIIEEGKTLWVYSHNDGFYKVMLSGKFFYLPMSSMGPTYDDVWNGTPLP